MRPDSDRRDSSQRKTNRPMQAIRMQDVWANAKQRKVVGFEDAMRRDSGMASTRRMGGIIPIILPDYARQLWTPSLEAGTV